MSNTYIPGSLLRGEGPHPMAQHFHQSNLIENVDSAEEDARTQDAWEWLRQQPELHLSVILGTHLRVMKGLAPDIAGQIRECHVIAGGRVCPNPDTVPALLRGFVSLMKDPLERDPREMHVTFEHIHPFEDGTGRVGRLLMWWHEVQRGEEPTLIAFDERHEYYKWFKGA